MANAYAAADVFVTPAQQDNLPNTVLESLACGTPVVAFNIGGIPDMISHLKNGYLAKFQDVQDLQNGILYCLDNDLSANTRSAVLEMVDAKNVAEQYISVFQNLCK
jgi:glycosyltransferase involved in cell wall biosynthesis